MPVGQGGVLMGEGSWIGPDAGVHHQFDLDGVRQVRNQAPSREEADARLADAEAAIVEGAVDQLGRSQADECTRNIRETICNPSARETAALGSYAINCLRCLSYCACPFECI